MTTIPSPTLPSEPDRHPRPPRRRRAVAAVGVLACVPYLALKTTWLAGSHVGLHDAAVAEDPVMRAANALTLVLELSAVALLVALAGSTARRLPALVVQVPTFVGTGLLGTIVVALPVQAVLGLLAPPDPADAAVEGPIEGWVYPVVYGAFGVLGVCLLGLAARHAWERWVVPGGWRTPLGAWAVGAPLGRGRRGAVLMLALALVVAGLAEAVVAARRADGVGVAGAVGVVAAVAAAAGLVALGWRRPHRLAAWVPLTAVYVCTAAVATWGLYAALVLAVPNPLRGTGSAPVDLVALEVTRAVVALAAVLLLPRLRGRTAPLSPAAAGPAGAPARPAGRRG